MLLENRSRFLRSFRSDLTRSLGKERVRSDPNRPKNRLQGRVKKILRAGEQTEVKGSNLADLAARYLSMFYSTEIRVEKYSIISMFASIHVQFLCT